MLSLSLPQQRPAGPAFRRSPHRPRHQRRSVAGTAYLKSSTALFSCSCMTLIYFLDLLNKRSVFARCIMPTYNAIAQWASRVRIPARGPFLIPPPSLSHTLLHVYSTLSYLNKGKIKKYILKKETVYKMCLI